MTAPSELCPTARLAAPSGYRPLGGDIAVRTLFIAVAKRSADIRARPCAAIREARMRRHGRCRIAKCVEVELNRDHSIFDMEGKEVKSVSFARFYCTDRDGRRWRYRDILTAQARYLREEAQREGRGTLCGQPESDLTLDGVVGPEGDPAFVGSNGRHAFGHVADDAHFPLHDLRPARAPDPEALLDLGKVRIKHVTAAPVKVKA